MDTEGKAGGLHGIFSGESMLCVRNRKKGIFSPAMKLRLQDVYSGNGLNFFEEKKVHCNYDGVLQRHSEFPGGKFANYMSEKHPDSSTYYGIMNTASVWGEATEEFNDPTPLSEDINWKLEIVLPCRQGRTTKSMTELLFCMLQSRR